MKRMSPPGWGQMVTPRRVYLDDVERLCEVFDRLCGGFTIQAGEYLLTDVSKLASLGVGRLDDLVITGNSPPLVLRTGLESVWVSYINEDSLQAMKATDEIMNILKTAPEVKKSV